GSVWGFSAPAAVDRLPATPVGISMSGGLDSPMLAASARSAGPESCELQAHTIVYDHVIPDEERKFAGLVARALDIPIHFFAADSYAPFERWDQPEQQSPEPANVSFQALAMDFCAQIAAHGRV